MKMQSSAGRMVKSDDPDLGVEIRLPRLVTVGLGDECMVHLKGSSFETSIKVSLETHIRRYVGRWQDLRCRKG